MTQAVQAVQSDVVTSLVEGVRQRGSVHAYLFVGEAGIGKRQAAFAFARALLCSRPDRAPCGSCENCIQFASGNNPDLNRLCLADLSGKKSIGADDIRGVIADAYIRPFQARHKVYILEDGDSLTVQAQNAMLKILEEPPPYVVFILCTTNLGLILPTVQSRSQIVHFHPDSDEEIRRYVLDKYSTASEQLDFICAYAQGIKGRADEICADESAFALRQQACQQLCLLLRPHEEKRIFEIANFFEKNKKNKENTVDKTPMILEFMLSQCSDMLKLRKGIACKLVNPDLEAMLSDAARACSSAKLAYTMQRLFMAQQMLRRYVSHKALILYFLLGVSTYGGETSFK